MDNRTIIIRANRHEGIIMSVAGLFSRRNIQVESMYCFSGDTAGEMVFIVTCADPGMAERAVRHLSAMHDVIDARYDSLIPDVSPIRIGERAVL